MSTYTKRPGFERELASPTIIAETGSVRVQLQNETQFGEVLTASRTPIIELNSAYGTSALRDRIELIGTGSKDDVNGTITTGEVYLSTGATAGSSACVISAATGRYIPGYSAEIGIGVRLPTVPTTDQAIRWGGTTQTKSDGFHYKYTSAGMAVVRRRGGVEVESVAQADWNIDKLDGTGASGYTLDVTKGHIYQIEYTWYGYGAIRFQIVGTTAGNRQRPIPVHEITIGTFSGTSVTDPSLRLFVDTDNGTEAKDIDVYFGGRQYSIIGDYIPKYRYTGDTRTSTAVTTTLTPLISFRHKTNYLNRSLRIHTYNLYNTGATIPVKVFIMSGGTVTGGSWVTPTQYAAAETGVEVNTSSTSFSGGNVLFAGDFVGPARDGGIALENLTLDLPVGDPVTLAAVAFSGSQACYAGFRLREEW
tara:strand:- start:8 stop:1267 length:1260 start_codon:yes stop_codon:yes gene_type:complete